MENYSQKLVKRVCREKEKQEWANSHASITSKIKYFFFLTFAGNKRLKLVVAAVALSSSWFDCCNKQYVAKTILAASKRQNRQETAVFSLSMSGQGSLAQAGLSGHLQRWLLAPLVKRKPPISTCGDDGHLFVRHQSEWSENTVRVLRVPPVPQHSLLLTSLALHRARVWHCRVPSHA